MDAKRTEGEAAMKEGKKLSSKTLFRWKPDWDHASIAFDKAGLCFKNAKEFEKALEAYTLSGEAHEKCHLYVCINTAVFVCPSCAEQTHSLISYLHVYICMYVCMCVSL
eukprot:TRINITY_DN603_c0_g4_i2.p1 TRINITY_DN603_c0_g4~~TRINITY_DN603_c0_g4_i2.p1  ORF type:complete len:109 (-),score=18.35 TRINITY_DN603_c0_g4_i2:26-352(-)